MFNRVIIVGNLTRDPDIRYTPSGIPVTNLTVAVNSRYRQNGEVKEEVLFMDTVVFGKQAESCNQYLSKGSPVLVEGRLRERRWEQEGVQKSKLELVARDVRFMPSKAKERVEQIEEDGSDVPF